MKWLLNKIKLLCEKFKRFFKGEEKCQHEITYVKGYGYRCKHCWKPKSQCISEWERKKTHVGV